MYSLVGRWGGGGGDLEGKHMYTIFDIQLW